MRTSFNHTEQLTFRTFTRLVEFVYAKYETFPKSLLNMKNIIFWQPRWYILYFWYSKTPEQNCTNHTHTHTQKLNTTTRNVWMGGKTVHFVSTSLPCLCGCPSPWQGGERQHEPFLCSAQQIWIELNCFCAVVWIEIGLEKFYTFFCVLLSLHSVFSLHLTGDVSCSMLN